MTAPGILITGAARGFGRALCQVFVADGWRVFALVRSRADAGVLTSAHPEGLSAFVADVRDESVASRIRAVIEANGGGLKVLVNNAGHSGSELRLQALKAEALADQFDLHCLGAMRCARAALPFLQQSEDALVVNMSSRLGSLERNARGVFPAGRYSYDYRIAKAAQNMLTLCLSGELSGSGVSVCAIHPGRLKTASGGDDADIAPEEAAEKLLRFVKMATADVNGRFFDLFDGEIPW